MSFRECTGVFLWINFKINETFMYEKSANKESDIVFAYESCDVPKVSSINNYRWIPDMDFKYGCFIYFYNINYYNGKNYIHTFNFILLKQLWWSYKYSVV